jgi:type VI protein secretion system component VasF
MNSPRDEDILATLREIRDDQRELLTQIQAQRALAEQQMAQSKQRIEESVGLQREALRRQRTITVVALPALLLCIAAIAWLLLRYF